MENTIKKSLFKYIFYNIIYDQNLIVTTYMETFNKNFKFNNYVK